MRELERLLNFHKSPLGEKFKQLCKPLEDIFGIDMFEYYSISSSGTCSLFNNRPEVIDYYYRNNLFRQNPYLRHPDNYTTTALFPLCDPALIAANSQILKKFGIDHNLTLLLKEKSHFHAFSFFTINKPAIPMETMFLNNLDLFIKFRDYFLNEWNLYRRKTDKYSINLADLIGPHFFKPLDRDYLHLLPESKRLEFLAAIGHVPVRPESAMSQVRDNLARKALTLIEQNLYENITIDDLAKTIGTSPSTLKRHFKKSMKQALYTYIMNRRLDEAMKLITEGKVPIAQAARRIGYKDVPAFTVAFKLKFGKPPSYFKEKK